ncbi:hypothetical protein MSAN_01999400 [Mycena sanguinolenta]|uniref:Uncharacterized protein n=1 Tax=Mycena sanguinolenta TaxID=230812 RepID=A0A8H7CM54_9AGAR|nr:hypothetical protein MSAN_01999400 [Mycena sanguinolenta]
MKVERSGDDLDVVGGETTTRWRMESRSRRSDVCWKARVARHKAVAVDADSEPCTDPLLVLCSASRFPLALSRSLATGMAQRSILDSAPFIPNLGLSSLLPAFTRMKSSPANQTSGVVDPWFDSSV